MAVVVVEWEDRPVRIWVRFYWEKKTKTNMNIVVFVRMASALKFPDPFNFSASNLAVEWAQWRTQFECYILATRKAEKNEDVLVLPILSTFSIITVQTYSK